MTQPTVVAGTKLLVLVGNGATPEVFAEPCGLTTKSFDLSAATNTALIPDCADPEAPVWEAKLVSSLAAQISGSGIMAVEAHAIWEAWFIAALAKNCQIKLNAAALGYYSGSFILTSLRYGGQRGQFINVDLTMVNASAVTWTSVP